MERVFEILYNLSINNKIISIYDMNKLLELLIDEKKLDDYILNIDIQQIRSNKLASYSHPQKSIIVYSNIIDKMINNISKCLITNNDTTKYFYINLRILQVILHEMEHANQTRVINYNNLEGFILRIASLVPQKKQIYEFSPSERFAEIKSYEDLKHILNYGNEKSIVALIEMDLLQRNMRGYHYKNEMVVAPIISYFSLGEKEKLLYSFDWYNSNTNGINYNLEERQFYGFPITSMEYYKNMHTLIKGLNNSYKNKVKIMEL